MIDGKRALLQPAPNDRFYIVLVGSHGDPDGIYGAVHGYTEAELPEALRNAGVAETTIADLIAGSVCKGDN